jgi:hypothetical protein
MPRRHRGRERLHHRQQQIHCRRRPSPHLDKLHARTNLGVSGGLHRIQAHQSRSKCSTDNREKVEEGREELTCMCGVARRRSRGTAAREGATSTVREDDERTRAQQQQNTARADEGEAGCQDNEERPGAEMGATARQTPPVPVPAPARR